MSDPFDDSKISDRAVTQRHQCGLIRRAVVRCLRLLHAREFDQHRARQTTGLEGQRRRPARENAATLCLQRGTGKVRVGSEPVGVLDLEVARNPIRFGHVPGFEVTI